MKNGSLYIAALSLLLASAVRAESATVSAPKIRAKATPRTPAPPSTSSLQPDSDVIDAPTTAVLDDHGYSTRSRIYSQGGMLEHLAFGVYPGVNLGVSAAVDGLVGDQKEVRMRPPTIQVKYRFFEGDQVFPSLAAGYDGQGYRYNSVNRRFNQRQRGFYVVASKEIGVPGLQLHPSFNISDFDSNAIFGSLPLTFNIRDRVELLAEWDNVNNWNDSRFNAGLRAYITPAFHADFAVRAIGAGGVYIDGSHKGSERVVSLKYSGSF